MKIKVKKPVAHVKGLESDEERSDEALLEILKPCPICGKKGGIYMEHDCNYKNIALRATKICCNQCSLELWSRPYKVDEIFAVKAKNAYELAQTWNERHYLKFDSYNISDLIKILWKKFLWDIS